MQDHEEKSVSSPANASSPVANSPESKNFWKELIRLVVIAGIIIVPFRLYVAQPFIVEGESMDPTFKNGQYLIVDELTYHFKTPERGSVLIFRYPNNPSKYFIKRVIGLPGETVSINQGKVTITETTGNLVTLLDEPYIVYAKNDSSTYTLKQGEYFVMGDNRLGSADSRLWGPVPEDNIIGRPFLRFYPPSVWPGDANYEEGAELNNNNP